MSSQTRFYGVRPKLSSSTTASLILTYKPIIFLLFAGPSFIMSLPFVAVVLRIVFGIITGQHTLLTICMTAFLSKIVENSIMKKETSIGNSTEIDFFHRMKSVPNKAKGRSNSIDPIVVPTVRALCAYAGGLGEALSLISDSDDKMLNDSWVLPSGALFMGECAIRGATHCIFQGIDFPRSGTNLAFFIPVLLNSAYKLDNGLLRYQQATNGSPALDVTCKAKLLHAMTPQFLPVFHTCNNCAEILLQTAKVNEGFRTLDFLKYLDLDGRNWLESKMAASVHVGRSMHVRDETSPN